jgi:hypothetical protein
MVKSCKEIAKDIEELRRKIQQNRLTEIVLAGIAERKRCESDSVFEMCKDCTCWKNVRERIL